MVDRAPKIAALWLCCAFGAIAAVGPSPPARPSSQPDRYVATGGCRDGIPNGAYRLSTSDGMTVVSGAFAHGAKTGTYVFWTNAGARVAVIPYELDHKNGTVALWYAAGGQKRESGRRFESPFTNDRLQGTLRSWWRTGALRGEYRYEQGMLQESRGWKADGAPVDPESAAREAARDVAEVLKTVASLEAQVQHHLPSCGGPLPVQG